MLLHLGSYLTSHIWTPTLSELYIHHHLSTNLRCHISLGSAHTLGNSHSLAFSHLSLLVTKSLPAKSVHLRSTEEAVKTSMALLKAWKFFQNTSIQRWPRLEKHWRETHIGMPVLEDFVSSQDGRRKCSSSFTLAPALCTAMPLIESSQQLWRSGSVIPVTLQLSQQRLLRAPENVPRSHYLAKYLELKFEPSSVRFQILSFFSIVFILTFEMVRNKVKQDSG